MKTRSNNQSHVEPEIEGLGELIGQFDSKLKESTDRIGNGIVTFRGQIFNMSIVDSALLPVDALRIFIPADTAACVLHCFLPDSEAELLLFFREKELFYNDEFHQYLNTIVKNYYERELSMFQHSFIDWGDFELPDSIAPLLFVRQVSSSSSDIILISLLRMA